MSISPIMRPSRPIGTNKIPQGTFAYFKARLKQRMFNVVIGEFRKSGLTKADYGKRLGMDAAQVNRLLGGPGNLTLETVSALLFAATGAELSGLSLGYPLHQEAPEIEPHTREAIEPLANRNVEDNQSLQEMRLGGLAGLARVRAGHKVYGLAPLNSPGINRTGLESGYVPIQAVGGDVFPGGAPGAKFGVPQTGAGWASSTLQTADVELVG